jgi:hypothetical protein
MVYPAIVYELDDMAISHADDGPYRIKDRYLITVIDPEPDSSIRKSVAMLPTARFQRRFVVDNLNHFVLYLHF